MTDFDHYIRGGPLAGISMTVAGIAGFCYHTAARWLQGPVGASPAIGAWTWDELAANVPAILTLAGGIITWVSLQRGKLHEMHLKQQEQQEDADRHKYLKDTLAEITVLKATMALRHEELCQRLGQQDDDIAAVRAAVSPPKNDELTSDD